MGPNEGTKDEQAALGSLDETIEDLQESLRKHIPSELDRNRFKGKTYGVSSKKPSLEDLDRR